MTHTYGRFWLVMALLAMLLSACGGTQPVQSGVGQQTTPGVPAAPVPTPGLVPPGGDGNYEAGFGAEQDLTIYTLTGIVQAVPGAVTTSSFQSTISGSGGRYGSYMSGYSSGGTDGKGIVRFLVEQVEMVDPYEGVPGKRTKWEPLAEAGDTVVLKSDDAGAIVLVAGDRVSFMCRVDTDFARAVAVNERATLQSATREFDYCRLESPVIKDPVVLGTEVVTGTDVISP